MGLRRLGLYAVVAGFDRHGAGGGGGLGPAAVIGGLRRSGLRGFGGVLVRLGTGRGLGSGILGLGNRSGPRPHDDGGLFEDVN